MGRKIACACGKRLVVKDSFPGGSIRCPGCGQLVHVIVDSGTRPEPNYDEGPAISVPGIHSSGTKRRRRAKGTPWYKPVGFTLLGVLAATALCFKVALRAIRSQSAGDENQVVYHVSGNTPSQGGGAGSSAASGDGSSREQAAAPARKKKRKAAADQTQDGSPEERSGVFVDNGPDDRISVRRIGRGKEGSAGNDDEDEEDEEDSKAAVGVAKLADLIDEVERCVVRLDCQAEDGKSVGSGFIIDAEGTIVTNYHVVEQVKTMTATFNDRSTLAIAGFKFVVPDKDLAVIQTAPPKRPLPFLRIARKLPRKGDKVVAFGSPLGLSFSASEGIVSGIRPSKELAELGMDVAGTWIQMTTQISPGNSGGPLVTTRGEVVGVNTMTLTAGQNLNFAISCEDARAAVEKAKGEQVTALSPERLPPGKGKRRVSADFDAADDVHLAKSDLSPAEAARFKTLRQSVWFGVKWLDVSDFDAVATRGLPTRSGVVVTDVAYHSPAYRAGIKVGDVIRAIDGNNASQSSVVEDLVDEFEAGEEVVLTIMRPEGPGRYSKKQLTVTIEGLIPEKALKHIANSELPVEIRDFLKRHLMHYYAALADSIKAAGQAAKRSRNRSSTAEGLSAKELRAMSPFDPLFLPSFGTDVPVHVGNIGDLKRVQVLAVVSKKMVVARINRGLIALLGDTSNLVDGEFVNLGTAQICGTVSIEIPEIDRSVKIFVARPMAVDKYLPEIERDEEDDEA